MRKGEKLQDFVTGFLQNGTVVGRPCDIMKLDANSFLFTDDHSGVVYLVRKKGTTTEIAQDAPAAELPPSTGAAPEGRSCLTLALLFTGALLGRFR